MADLSADKQLTFTDSGENASIYQSHRSDRSLSVTANGDLKLQANGGGNGGHDAQLQFINNSTVQGYFDYGGDLNLKQDLRWPDNISPVLRCYGGLRVHLNEDGSSVANKKFEVVIAGTPYSLFVVDPGGERVQSYKMIEMAGSDSEDRKITTATGELEVSAVSNVDVICNAKNTASGSLVRFKYYQTTLATFDNDQAVFYRKVDANTEGIRTKAQSGSPSGGMSGDLIVDTTNTRLWVKVGSTWRYASLT
jgi:hypothetical protein